MPDIIELPRDQAEVRGVRNTHYALLALQAKGDAEPTRPVHVGAILANAADELEADYESLYNSER